MISRLQRTFILSVSTLALLVGPMVMAGIRLLSSAAVAGNGNGGDGSNGNGNGGGQGNSGGDQGNSGGDQGNSGNSGSGNVSGNEGGNGNSRAPRNATTETSGGVETGKGQARGKAGATEIASTEGDSPRERTRTLKAELAGLSSLKRNINGLMNSSDPRMDGRVRSNSYSARSRTGGRTGAQMIVGEIMSVCCGASYKQHLRQLSAYVRPAGTPPDNLGFRLVRDPGWPKRLTFWLQV